VPLREIFVGPQAIREAASYSPQPSGRPPPSNDTLRGEQFGGDTTFEVVAEDNNNRMMRPSSTRYASIPEQIAALARLNEQGVLSDAEFEEKKRELLKRI
jgi:hypothetical protein